ncbi:hypothetical protein BO71DRAFT_401401 [Aspergillus ellipticus CBS 707.79]|uniref:Uncharacterized protein n=1 Tax=Aspergillus ellipticus CBS 707.79 TaxID=1448320 RepID=A0A319EKG9_9EURO|nr:hypothetical protein BO71DRAFT_401401 [Aspergillus ellipticus CBS 707.79]
MFRQWVDCCFAVGLSFCCFAFVSVMNSAVHSPQYPQCSRHPILLGMVWANPLGFVGVFHSRFYGGLGIEKRVPASLQKRLAAMVARLG